jgi:hypothetical protein
LLIEKVLEFRIEKQSIELSDQAPQPSRYVHHHLEATTVQNAIDTPILLQRTKQL